MTRIQAVAEPKRAAAETTPGGAWDSVAHLYVHVPFCARRCAYCDFAVEARRDPPGQEWLAAISLEAERAAREGLLGGAGALKTLYVGGGTPSLLDPRIVARTGRIAGAEVLPGQEIEWTVEANPESFSAETARVWRRAGVNRVSFGAQSFSRTALKWMGRLHGPGRVAKAVDKARAQGLKNLSVDLIFGLPDEVERSMSDDLDSLLALGAPHVSLYGLTVEKGTPLAEWIRSGRTSPPRDARYEDEYRLAVERLKGAGYEHYEVSNFALPGSRSRHNAAYWDGSPYLGLGPGAHSFAAGERWWNRRSFQGYVQGVSGKDGARAGQERPTPDQRRLERIWLALRRREGVGADLLNDAARRAVGEWVRRGLAVEEFKRVRLTTEGWLLLDSCAVELDLALASSPIQSPEPV